jgi:putative ABC transport system permease protein
VGRHYLQLVVIIPIGRSGAGLAGGAALGRQVLGIYRSFFAFPVFEYRLPAWIVASAVSISLITALLATWRPIRRATRVPPAVAMRPEPPADFRRTLIERIGLARFLPVTLRMILRHLERRPVRSLLTALGLSMATAVLVTGNFVVDTLGFVGDFQFNRASRQSMTVAFVEAAESGAASELASLPGVRRVEPFRRCRAAEPRQPLAPAGDHGAGGRGDVVAAARCQRAEIPLPERGVLLSVKLAEIWGAAGDTLRVDVLRAAAERLGRGQGGDRRSAGPQRVR